MSFYRIRVVNTLVLVVVLLLLSCKADQQTDTTVNTASVITDTVEAVVVPVDTPSLPPLDYDTTQWTEVVRLDSTILLDLRYATDSNFVGEQMYDCGRCFLRPPVARAVVAVHQKLQEEGLGLKMFDCYRPRPVQQKLWDKVPDARYVADPRKGSMHNRGTAVDLTIVDSTGQQLDMGTPYDFFGKEAYPAYRDLPETVLSNRQLLHESMKAAGFAAIRTEWWHFSLAGRSYPLDDMLWNCD